MTCHASYPLNSDDTVRRFHVRNTVRRQLDGCDGDTAAERGNDESPNKPLRHMNLAGRIYWTKVSMKSSLLCPTSMM